MSPFIRALTVAALSAPLAACIIEDAPSRRRVYEGPPPDDLTASSSSSSSSGSAPGSIGPMLVEVDTDQTMTADPGQGVGVFVEYARGGRWHVWWTCDTAKTRQDCDFAVNVGATTGTLTNVDATELAGGAVATPTPARLEAKVRTSNQVHGVSFSSLPGAAITLDATVGGIRDGAFLFFVQDGKVNGGFAGKLTNPLSLQGKTP